MLTLGVLRPQPLLSSAQQHDVLMLVFGVPVGVQEHRAFADRHRGAECGNVALGGFHGNYVHLRSVSGAGLHI